MLPRDVASGMALRADLLPVALRRLGFRIIPGVGHEYGPPTPAMLIPLRRRRELAAPPPMPTQRMMTGPFAALAALRR